MNPANVSVDEAVTFLERFPDVEAVDLILYDGNGVGRGKIIRRAELVHVFEQGCPACEYPRAGHAVRCGCHRPRLGSG